MNVLFNRETLKAVGLNRPATSFEIEINNVDVTNLTKPIQITELVEDENLYLLPQPDVEVTSIVEKQVETIEVTENPVMVKVTKKVPLMENGVQVNYEITNYGETTEVTDEPVMIVVTSEDGTSEEVQKTDEDGNLLFLGEIRTGIFVDCFTTEEVEEQKKDAEGNLVFFQTIEEEVVSIEPQLPLHITKENELWTAELEKVKNEVERTVIVQFNEAMDQFTYDDVVAQKQLQVIKDTFFSKALLVETMEQELFSTNLSTFNADLGFGFISLPVGGEVRTIKLTLPQVTDVVGVKTETSVDGVEVKIGATAGDLQLLSKGERYFDSVISEVYVNFKNTTDKRIDIHSFALLV